MSTALDHDPADEDLPVLADRADGEAGSSVQTLERQDEIGDVIVKAQQFADETALEAHNRALAVVEKAKAEAARIVNEARLQAATMGTPQRVVVPAETVADLFATIDEFIRTNEELVTELAMLRSVLSTDRV